MSGANPPGATIGPIALVTIATPDLAASENAYVEHLGYRIGERTRIAPEQARSWRCPAAAGAPCLTVYPEAGEDFGFRFVQTPPVDGYRAFSGFGWHAAELIVRDVDALATKLPGSAFEILGSPQDLSFTDAIRAMQARGPAGEILYLTQFKRPLESLPAPPARCDADRVFIVILGGPSLGELLDFYARRFGVTAPQRMESRVKAMSEVFGFSPEHRYQIAALPLQGSCYIEADEMPPGARPLQVQAGHLPPGIAIVSFRSRTVGSPVSLAGAAGELIELLPG
jgi:catechol 2,3-dioxygenase-like lactoylglutathione lyase family enzyme